MSIIENALKELRYAVLGVVFEAGKYQDGTYSICGKIIFAGGMNISDYDAPRNVLGGEVLHSEVFKVVLRGDDYVALETNLKKVQATLRRVGFIQLSGLEHIEPKDDGLMQLAVTFKSA